MPQCEHVKDIKTYIPRAKGCEECMKMGDRWIHLRVCLICGHVGCCNSSKNKHATQHFKETGHAMMRSLEPGEVWGYCFVDDIFYETI